MLYEYRTNITRSIKLSKRSTKVEKDEYTYKRDLRKRVELIKQVLDNTKNTEIQICELESL